MPPANRDLKVIDGATGEEVAVVPIDYFVEPDTTRLQLPEWHAWIDIKAELTYGELKRIQALGLTALRSGANDKGVEISADFSEMDTQKLNMRLVAWSLTDRQGKPVRLTPDAIAHLKPALAEAMVAAIAEHDAAQDAAKNG